jgi:branched-chain amino acid transport system ATP-binding protein
MALLEVDQIVKRFGGLLAVNEVSFEVDRGQIVSMIGPNGAGKTTAFNCITGLYPLTAGDVRFDGVSLMGMPPHRITRLGITRTFQNIRLFSYMTAVDNVMVGEHCRMHAKVWDDVLHTRKARAEERAVEARALATLRRLATPTSMRATCPTACSAAWRSPARWPAVPPCCSSTSPPPASIPTRRWT